MVSRELARAGKRVLLVERERFPRDKVCGGCLGPVAMQALAAVGLGDLPLLCGATPVERFQWSAMRQRITVPVGGGVVISRATLDAALVAAAQDDGVEFRDGVSAVVEAPQGRVVPVRLRDGETVAAPLVIAATGLGGGDVARGSLLGAGLVFEGFECLGGGGPLNGLKPGTIYMGHSWGGYVGAAVGEHGRIVAAAALTQSTARQSGIGFAVDYIVKNAGLPDIPTWGEQWKGTPLLTRQRSRAYDERVLYLGDAVGYVEPFTGEGMGLALESARLLAPLAAAGWRPETGREWQAILDERVRPAQRRCRTLTRFLHSERRAALGILLLRGLPFLAPRIIRSTTTWAST